MNDDEDSDTTPRVTTKEQKSAKYKAVLDSLDTDRSGFLSSDELLQAVIALVWLTIHLSRFILRMTQQEIDFACLCGV